MVMMERILIKEMGQDRSSEVIYLFLQASASILLPQGSWDES